MSNPTIKSYNKKAKELAKRFDDFGNESAIIKRTFSYLKKKNPRVIELGCGNGRDAAEIIKYTNDYLGTDASQALIALAKKKLPKAHFKVANFETYHFPQNVDIVFAFASLLHTDKQTVKKILHRAHASLTERGLFCITLQDAPYRRKVVKNAYGARTFYFYEPKDVRELSRNNYKILEMRRKGFKSGHWLKIVLQKA